MVTTRGGDSGKSSLLGGEFVYKNDFRFELIGTIDELTSYLGICRQSIFSLSDKSRGTLNDEIKTVQRALYRIMSVLALNGLTLPAEMFDKTYSTLSPLKEEEIDTIESWEHRYLKTVKIEPKFVIPGDGSRPAAYLDYARALTRKAERRLVSLIHDHNGSAYRNVQDLYLSQRYLNRLSDYLFIIARYIDEIR